MRSVPNLVVLVCILSSSVKAVEERTWVEIDGKVYGAQPDDRGPIGGGVGYRDIVKSGDFEVKNLDALIDALSTAEAGQVVFIPDETEIDLTSRIYIERLVIDVPEGVTLAGERGNNGSLGAILTSDALNTPLMIRATGPNVRVTGIRIRGPNRKQYLDHHRRAFRRGGEGRPYYYRFPTSNGIQTRHANLQVDNCDISGFGHGAIDLVGGQGHIIHHNFIHHCQYNGLGYGVVHHVSSSTIEYNLFDWNRHSIAGTGRPGCSYIARHNVELGESLSHSFDMHGGRDRKDGTDIAGTTILISNNTFQAKESPIAIRGIPQEGCDVTGNWFPKHGSPRRAVKTSGRTTVLDNAYGNPPAVK